MVPVINNNKKPLMPCSEKRARKLMEKGQAKVYWYKGIFCIRLTKEPSNDKYQSIALGVDPGSKREGYTIATEKAVIFNITTNTPSQVKDSIETRKNLRRARRYRKTPYRKCRNNRATLTKNNRIPPSTKSRWNAKLRIIKNIKKVIPIAIVNVEDIKAISKKDKDKWNKSFSPLEVGKKWFYSEIEALGLFLIKTDGIDTKTHRDNRSFSKSKDKLKYNWNTHNVDSHSLVEMALELNIKPFKGLIKVELNQYDRRKLHEELPKKGGHRKAHGGTVSCGMGRNLFVHYSNHSKNIKNKILLMGAYDNTTKRFSLKDPTSIKTDNRFTRNATIDQIKPLYYCAYRCIYLPVKPSEQLSEIEKLAPSRVKRKSKKFIGLVSISDVKSKRAKFVPIKKKVGARKPSRK